MNPFLALIIANIIWGAGSPIMKLGLTNIPIYTFIFIRFFFASFIFLPFVFKYKQKLIFKDYIKIFLTALVAITIHMSFYFLGLQKTLSINAPIIASASPVFLFFLSVIFLKEKLIFRVFYGMLISLFGVLVIILSPLVTNKNINVALSIEGNIFLVLATAASLIAVLLHKKILDKVNPYVLGFWTMFFGSLPFIPLVVKELQTWSFSQINFAGGFGLMYGLFFNSAIAYTLYYYGLSKINAQEIGLFSYIDPVIAILIAAPLLGEMPDNFFILGALFIFWGIYLAEKRLHWYPFQKLKK